MDDMKKHTTNQADDDELFSSSDDLFSRKSDTMDEEFNFMDDFEDTQKQTTETGGAYGDVLGEGTPNEFSPEEGFEETKKRGGGVKKILIVFVLLIVGAGLYYIFRSEGGGEGRIKEISFEKSQKMAEKPTALEEKIAEEIVAPGVTTEERLRVFETTLMQINTQLNILQTTQDRLGKIEEVLQKLSEDAASKEQSLAALEQVSGRMTGVATLDQRMIALEKRVQALQEEIELQTLAAARAQRSVNASKQVEQAMSAQPIGMVVQAAIPGRAWLLSEAGELLTVTRGDEVPGYGRVMSIDPVAGTVVMSSKAVFREE